MSPYIRMSSRARTICPPAQQVLRRAVRPGLGVSTLGGNLGAVRHLVSRRVRGSPFLVQDALALRVHGPCAPQVDRPPQLLQPLQSAAWRSFSTRRHATQETNPLVDILVCQLYCTFWFLLLNDSREERTRSCFGQQ